MDFIYHYLSIFASVRFVEINGLIDFLSSIEYAIAEKVYDSVAYKIVVSNCIIFHASYLLNNNLIYLISINVHFKGVLIKS